MSWNIERKSKAGWVLVQQTSSQEAGLKVLYAQKTPGNFRLVTTSGVVVSERSICR